MNLLVDIGNSRIKWAIKKNIEKLSANVGAYDKSDPEKYLNKNWIDIPLINKILVANVAGDEVADKIRAWAEKRWHKKIQFVRVRKKAFGVVNAYTDISQLGVDRWLAIIAAWNKYRQSVCVVDCGTAITVDGVSSGGMHSGGIIMPGIAMMQNSLVQDTAGINTIGLSLLEKIGFADNTEQAINNGCYMAVVAMIKHILHNMDGIVIITGGDGQSIANFLPCECLYEPDLVLNGMELMAGD